ncbi:methanogenesis marker 16 metalloprotein [Methanobacterium alcaliphilum]|uniref:methanogenesis marker 16 metalloprotein n=1 Tax=Methanobacterium alcaliphilum TaxID=392018 RepID=UPI00200B7348|nr:methanogenesis marker 16 metalloprotein [Methanobacterium alcaliphilum]
MVKRTIGEINQKIADGEATVLTAEEVTQRVMDGRAPTLEDVDVVTTGTCGIMSGTAAILHLKAGEPGSFKKAKKIYLNGVPGFPGPCPNEWLGSVDLMIYGTAHSIHDSDYGGGFLFKDMLAGREIEIEVESIHGEIIKSTTNLNEMGTARMIGTRMAFKNYTAFVNPDPEPVSSIFHAIDMDGPFEGLSFSGCGEINPLQNDPQMKTLCRGTKILLNGAEGFIIDNGTRSNLEKPNLMLTADMHEMDSHYLGGFRTAAGPEIYDSVAIAIPITSQEVLENTFIKNSDISLPVADIKGRHLPLTNTNYGEMWNGSDERPSYHCDKCMDCATCLVRERCPTLAFTHNLNTRKCFGCGMCAYSCPHGAFVMKTGYVELEVDLGEFEVPIACRQSDLKRAREITDELTNKIKKGKFSIYSCPDS